MATVFLPDFCLLIARSGGRCSRCRCSRGSISSLFERRRFGATTMRRESGRGRRWRCGGHSRRPFADLADHPGEGERRGILGVDDGSGLILVIVEIQHEALAAECHVEPGGGADNDAKEKCPKRSTMKLSRGGLARGGRDPGLSQHAAQKLNGNGLVLIGYGAIT